MNGNELIAKATAGKLSSRELEQVVKSLQAKNRDPYGALLIIGRAGAKQHRSLVERYLQASYDPMLARLAVLILCRYWGLTADYLTVLEQFIRKVEWDEEDDVRLMAISCIGTFLARKKERSLLALLLQIFRDSNEPTDIREEAYGALALATGKSPATRRVNLNRDIDPSVIATVEAFVEAPR